jgi:predicted enzyme related to lactoylglutathione lyase
MGSPVVHFEIITTDPPALAKFYSELFGWKTQEFMGGYFTIDTQAGSGINGGIGGSQQGPPTGAGFYVESADLQATLDKAASLGGSTAVPIVEMEMVTFAKIADPEGNQVGIVLAGEGPGVSPGDGRELGWWEILGANPGALRDFYTELFGWKVENTTTEGFEYHTIDTDAGGRGIKGGIGGSPDGQGHTNVYAGVDDLQKYCEIAESLGAKIVMPPTQVGEDTKIAMFVDPQGNTFGMYEGM